MDNVDTDIYLGEITDKECPKCGSFLLESKDGTVWCSESECLYSSDPQLSEFLKQLKTYVAEFYNI